MVQRYSHLSQKHKLEAVELLAKNSPTIIPKASDATETTAAVTCNVVNMMGR